MCRFSDAGDDDRLCTLKRPAFEKRQGRKSRSVVRRRFGWLYGDLAGASGLGCVVMIPHGSAPGWGPGGERASCTARDTDLRYEWLRVEWIEASLGAIGGEPTRIRNVRALIVRRHEVSILIVTGVGVGRYFGSQRRSRVSMMIMRPLPGLYRRT